jgi:hypothetical protein
MKFLNKIKLKIIYFWFKIPRVKINLSVKKYNLDSRSFGWYLQKKRYGFCEIDMWELGANFDTKVRNKYNLLDSKCTFLSSSTYNELFKLEQFEEDALWLYNRVSFYKEFKCPFTCYISGKDESEKIINKLLLILKHRSSGGHLVEAEVNLVVKYLGNLGW